MFPKKCSNPNTLKNPNTTISSRNSKPWSVRNFFFGSADYIIFEMVALSCYLFIHLDHIPFIRTSLSLTFYFITRILFLSPDRPGRSSSRSDIWIFLRLQISLWTLILNLGLLHEILLPCCVLTCFLLNSRSLPLLIGYLVCQQVDFSNNLASKFLISALSSVAVATATPPSSALK